ncbi:MAG: RloB family protein [Bacteroides sp.]
MYYVFCLIDMDYINADATRNQAYTKEKAWCIKAYKNAIYFIESNPAFEFWLLLHFVFTDRQFRNCNEVITELKKNGRIENYEKSIEYFSKNNLYTQLREKLDAAMGNARGLSSDANNPNAPYSRVFEVFEELVK